MDMKNFMPLNFDSFQKSYLFERQSVGGRGKGRGRERLYSHC